MVAEPPVTGGSGPAAAGPVVRVKGEPAPLGMWFSQFNIADQQVLEEGPFIGVFEGSGVAEGVNLYILTEPINAPAALCEEVMQVLAQAFGSPVAVLTTNLFAAIEAAHEYLVTWNASNEDGPTACVGMSCLVMRNDEAYLAQCGPALAVVRTSGRHRIFATEGDDSRRPLGIGSRPAPVTNRMSIAAGDVVVLAFSTATRLAEPGILANLANAAPEDALPYLYQIASQEHHFAGLYLAAMELTQPTAVSPHQEPVETPPATPLRSNVNAIGNARPEPLAPAVPMGSAGRYDAPPANAQEAVSPQQPERPKRITRAGMSPVRASDRPKKTALGTLNGRHVAISRRTLVIGGAAAGMVALAAIAGPVLLSRGDDGRFENLLRTADARLSEATTTSDLAQRRDLLTKAENALAEARSLRPQAPEVTQRSERIRAERATIDAARELAGVVDVAELAGAGVSREGALQLAAAGLIYVLDAGSGKVYGLPDGSGVSRIVFEEGQPVGNTKAGRARQLAYLPTSAGVNVIVLDSLQRLFTIDGSSVRQIPVQFPDDLKNDLAITAGPDALYVLSGNGPQVYRYRAGANGYEQRSEPLATASLPKDVTGISLIGVLWLTTSSGRLYRLENGAVSEVKLAGMDRPLLAPSAPLNAQNSGLVYVPDRGNQRFVVLAPDGTFRGQFFHQRLTGLRASALDPRGTNLYAVGGPSLIRAPLPM